MLAKINGLFRLTRDLELRYGTNGNAIAKLGLACSEKFGEKTTQLFIDGVAFGKSGEILNQYAGTKGTQIFLCGKLQTESWDKDGVKQYKTSMVIESFDFVGSKQDNQSQGQQNKGQQQSYQQPQQQTQQRIPEIDIDEDEIPFNRGQGSTHTQATTFYVKCITCETTFDTDKYDLDLEHDGDICGYCPNCKGSKIFYEVDKNGVYVDRD